MAEVMAGWWNPVARYIRWWSRSHLERPPELLSGDRVEVPIEYAGPARIAQGPPTVTGRGHGWTRREFLAGSGAIVGVAAMGVACTSDGGEEVSRDVSTGPTTGSPSGGVIVDGDVASEDDIFSWIERIFSEGVRRPAYPADRWAEGFVAERFRDLGLENVRSEPVPVTRWRPGDWSLEVIPADGEAQTLECFPVPYAAPTDGMELELAVYDPEQPDAVADRASLYDVSLLTIPADLLAGAGSAPDDASGRIIDPEGTLAGADHLVPFGSEFQEVMAPSIAAGAVAFIGSLRGVPGGSFSYFVPYDAVGREIPGVWVDEAAGDWLRGRLAEGAVRVRLRVGATSEPAESANIVGELPGADDEIVMIASHHDGPWSSAVEDASGVALTLAQASYWAAQPVEARPHRLVFLLQAGHMSGGAGLRTYIEEHRDELDDVVLEVHLEHAAREFAEVDGEPAPTGRPVPRWFFTSRIPQLEAAVAEALRAEELGRSMVLAPDAFGEQPPTDGALYHTAGVPVMNFLAAPFYLFDEMDTLDKIDRPGLVPLTRATIRMVDWTREVSATRLRAGVVGD